VASERRQRLFAGWAAMALGAFALAVIVGHPENLRTESWVAYAAASAFIFAGAAIVLGEFPESRRFAGWASLASVAGLAIPGLWIAFGPGPRNCTALLFFISTSAGEWVCRGAFGLGAVLMLAFLALMLRRLLKGSHSA